MKMLLLLLLAVLLASPAFAQPTPAETRMYCMAVGNSSTVIGNARDSGQSPQKAFDITKQIFGKWVDDNLIKIIVNSMYFNPGGNFDQGGVQVTNDCFALVGKTLYQPLK